MNSDKAPGPDGFIMALFQVCLDVLKEDIMNVLYDFHSIGKFERSIDTTFITLILKKFGAIDIKDFQPISLVSGVCKIATKVLANMLKMVVEKIISKPYNAFIRVGGS